MKNILVPYDFSEQANHALNFALQIAERSKGEVKIAHIIDYPTESALHIQGEISGSDPMEGIYVKRLIESTEKRLEQTINEQSTSVPLTYTIKLGNPFKTVAQEVEHQQNDLVVMGTSGAAGLDEILVGSNTEKMVRYAKCPVITLSEECDMNIINDIAFATNFEDEQDFIVRALGSYQELFDAKLHLVWVNTLQVFQDDEIVKEKLAELADNNGIRNYETHIFKALNPERGIMNFAESSNMDMIALATHGHRGLLHLFIGSIAENVVNHAHRPVWTLSVKAKP